jgi:hypothetical protein
MKPMQAAFLKNGWLQLGGEDIPVYFKYDPIGDPKFPFLVIFSEKLAYYDLYNQWVEKGHITEDQLEKNIPSIARAYDALRATPEMFQEGALAWISDYYAYEHNVQEANNYEHIRQILESNRKRVKKEKDAVNSSPEKV